MLQWGRSLSTAEVRRSRSSRHWPAAASMGPQSFDCGSYTLRSPLRQNITSFNGAAVFRLRKFIAIRALDRHARCFNGAAVFRLRKLKQVTNIAFAGISFNGAAVFRLRKYMSDGAAKRLAINLLQWGRSLSTAEVHLPVSL